MNKTLQLCVYLLLLSFFATPVFAIPGITTYQARIIKPDGLPLEAVGVNFRFTIMNPAGNCILYVEDYAAVNMTGTAGLISFSLGSGTKTYPASATVGFEDIFNNSTPSLTCQAAGTYSPGASDVRKIIMQFHDGAWQTLPAMNINAVPYAMYATDAQKLGGVSATSYVNYSTIPTCTASQALQYNGVGFSCIAAGGGGASGTVTAGDITTALGYTPANPATLSTSYTTSTSFATVTATVNTLGSSVTAVTSTVNDLSASLAAIVSSQWVTSGSAISYNSGNVGIGVSAPTAKLDVSGTIRAQSALHLDMQNQVSTVVPEVRFRRSKDVSGVATAVATNDRLGAIGAVGFDGTGYSVAQNSTIMFKAAENFTPTANGAFIAFETTGVSTTSRIERMRVAASGNVGIGTTTPVTNLDVSGGIKISMESATCAVSFAGTLRYNGSNIEFCNGSIWSAFGVAGAGVATFNGSTSATQSFANSLTGTAPLFATLNGVHTLNIPYASAGATTAGLISNSDYVNFNNKITSSAADIAQVLGYVPAASGAAFSSLDLGSASATGTLAEARLTSFVNVTSGSQYTKVTVDGKGRVTSGAQLSASDVTTALGFTPVSGTPSATKVARVATSANIALSGLQTIDTISLVAGDRVLVKNQSSYANNGLYIAAAGAWTRAPELDTWEEVLGAEVYVVDGLSNQGIAYMANTSVLAGTLNATSIYWTTRGANWFNGNIGFGLSALAKNVSGFDNAAFGNYSQSIVTTGSENTGVGNYTFEDLTTGNKNTAVGTSAMAGVSSGSLNTALGYRALASVGTGDGNIGIGANAGWLITTGSNNVVIGSNTGSSIATLSNNILLADGQGNERMRITSSGAVGIGTTTPKTTLDVSGGLRIGLEPAACTAALAGTLRYSGSVVEYCNGTSWSAFGVAGVGLANFNGSTSATQTLAAGFGGTAPSFSTINGVHTINIPNAASTSVTAGLLSNADYQNFTNKMNATSAAVISALGYTPVSATPNALATYQVRAATSTNITLSGNQTIDGVSVVAGDRVLVKNQSTQSENGVYVVNAGAWTRATDMNSWEKTIGYTAQVAEGTAWAGMTFISNTTVGGTLNSTVVAWTSAGSTGSNTANGLGALGSNTGGTTNTATGVNSLLSNTSGSDNTATGASSLLLNTIGSYNTANGVNSLFSNTSGSYNTANGYRSLYFNTGNYNTATGYRSLYLNSTGNNNTAVGYDALKNTTDSNNTGIGFSAGSAITTGTNNVVIGSNTGSNFATGSNNISISDGSGNERIRVVSSGNVGIGTTAPSAALEVSGGIKLSGAAATLDIPLTTSTTGYISMGGERLLHASENLSIFLGKSAGNLAGTSVQNTGIGYHALNSITFAYQNVAVGDFAMADITDGGENTAIGSQALSNSVSGLANVAIGVEALMNNTSNENTVVGAYALNSAGNGSKNTGTGYAVLNKITTGSNNVGAGWMALRNVTTGNSNIGVGYNAGSAITTGNYNVVIGSNTGSSIATVSNTVLISDGQGNERMRITSMGAVGIATTSPDSALTINSDNTKTTLHLTAMGGGGYLSARGNTSQLDVFGGYEYDLAASNYKARSTAAAGVEFNAGTFRVYTNSGLTSGNTFTPTERLRIDTSGNVGIGTTGPTEKLHVAGNAYVSTKLSIATSPSVDVLTVNGGIRTKGVMNMTFGETSYGTVDYMSGKTRIHTFGSTTASAGAFSVLLRSPNGSIINEAFLIDSSGKVGIGTSAPVTALDVVGDIQYTGTITDVSDRRLKTNIEPLDSALATVRKIKTYSYVMKDDPKARTEFGVMAQDMLGIIPQLVKTINAKGDYYGVNYLGLIPWSIRAIQEVDVETQNLKRENQEIKRELASLKEHNQVLEKKLEKILQALEQQKQHDEKK